MKLMNIKCNKIMNIKFLELYHRKYGKQPQTRAKSRLLVNEPVSRDIDSCPGYFSSTTLSVRLCWFTSTMVLALLSDCFPNFRW